MDNNSTTAAQPLDLDSLTRYDNSGFDGVGNCMEADIFGDYVKLSDARALIAQARAARPVDEAFSDSWKVVIGAAAALAHLHIEDDAEREQMMTHVRKIAAAIPTPARAAQPVQTGVAVDERALFEAWLRRRWPNAQRPIDEKTATGSYAFTENNLLWEAWQARASLAPVSAQPPIAGMHWSPSAGQWMLTVYADLPKIASETYKLYAAPVAAQQAAAKAPVCEACNGDGYYEHKGSDTECRVCGGSGAAKAPAAQAGFKLVPLVADKAMLHAGMRHFSDKREPATKAWECYRDMLAASPASTPEASQQAAAMAAPSDDEARDAARFREAIKLEDNAETLLMATINNYPDGDAIRAEFDSAMRATQQEGGK